MNLEKLVPSNILGVFNLDHAFVARKLIRKRKKVSVEKNNNFNCPFADFETPKINLKKLKLLRKCSKFTVLTLIKQIE